MNVDPVAGVSTRWPSRSMRTQLMVTPEMSRLLATAEVLAYIAGRS